MTSSRKLKFLADDFENHGTVLRFGEEGWVSDGAMILLGPDARKKVFIGPNHLRKEFNRPDAVEAIIRREGRLGVDPHTVCHVKTRPSETVFWSCDFTPIAGEMAGLEKAPDLQVLEQEPADKDDLNWIFLVDQTYNLVVLLAPRLARWIAGNSDWELCISPRNVKRIRRPARKGGGWAAGSMLLIRSKSTGRTLGAIMPMRD